MKAPKQPQLKEEVKYPAVTASSFMQAASCMPFVHYKEFPESFYSVFQQHKYKDVEQFDGRPLCDCFKDICDSFDQYNPDSAMIHSFTAYTKKHIPPEASKFIATFWPPILPASSAEHNFMPYFIVKVLHTVQNPINVFKWLSTTIFPTLFTRPVPDQLLAICRCKKGKAPGFWAILGTDKTFKLFSFKQNDPKEEFKGVVDKIAVGKDKISIDVFQKEKVVVNFTPENPGQIKIWSNIFQEKVPFPLQIASFATPAVDEFYTSLYQCVVNADAVVLRACLDPSVSSASAPSAFKIMKSFYTIFSHGQKANSCLCATFLSELNNPSLDIIQFLDGPSHSKNLLKHICVQNGKSYKQGFITKLAQYIDQSGGYGLGTQSVDVSGATKLVLSVVKLISHSFSEVPPVVSLALNIFRTYVATKTNSKVAIYKAVAEVFLKGFLLDQLADIKKSVPTIKNAAIFPPLCRLLYIIFSLGKLDGEFDCLSSLQARLDKHTYSLLIEFALTISEAPAKAVFPIPQADELPRAIESVAEAISALPDKFAASYSKILSAQGSSVLGNNFAGLLTNYFLHECDVDPPAQEKDEEDSSPKSPPESPSKKSHKYVKADKFESTEGLQVKNIVRIDPNAERDPTKKYYKRVHKQVPK